jgi:hypothetical protein
MDLREKEEGFSQENLELMELQRRGVKDFIFIFY